MGGRDLLRLKHLVPGHVVFCNGAAHEFVCACHPRGIDPSDVIPCRGQHEGDWLDSIL